MLNPKINEIIRFITGPISIFSSFVILYLIWAGKGKKNSYHRFMIGISLSDIVFTTAFLFGVTPLPKGLTPGAMGNMTTCELRAFFVQWFGVLEPLYNVCLEFYFVAVICYSIKPEDFTKRFEKWMHAFVNLSAFGIAIVGIVAQVYNPLVGKASGCYINSYPQGCKGQECTRGANARSYFFYLGILPYYFILFLLYGCLILIVWTVLRKDCKARRFQPQSQHSPQTRRRGTSSLSLRNSVLTITRPATTQAISYGIVFTLTYLAHAILRTVVYFNRLAIKKPGVVGIAFMSDFLLPLQGFFNLILYIRPKFNKLRKKFPSKSFWWYVRMSISRKSIQDITIQECHKKQNNAKKCPEPFTGRGEKNDEDPCDEEHSTYLRASNENVYVDRGSDLTKDITENSRNQSQQKSVLGEGDDVIASTEEGEKVNHKEGEGEVCPEISDRDQSQQKSVWGEGDDVIASTEEGEGEVPIFPIVTISKKKKKKILMLKCQNNGSVITRTNCV